MKSKPATHFFTRIAAMLLLLPVIAMAQNSPPPLAEMWNISPKAGHGQELYKAIGEHMKFRSENGDPRDWNVYTPVLGDELSRIGVRYCCINWADVDAYREWSDSNEAVGKHFSEHVAPHMENVGHYFSVLDWSNSNWNDSDGPYELFAVTEFNIKPGHAAEFDAARDKMSQIAINQGWAKDHVWAWTSRVGGSPQEGIVIPHKNFASMDRDEDSFFRFLADKLNSEEAAADLLGQFTKASVSTNYQIWEIQRDISMGGND